MVLATEISFYHQKQQRLAQLYPNHFLIIQRQHVYGGYLSILEAYSVAIEKFNLVWGTFLVIKVLPTIPIPNGRKFSMKVSSYIRLLEGAVSGKYMGVDKLH